MFLVPFSGFPLNQHNSETGRSMHALAMIQHCGHYFSPINCHHFFETSIDWWIFLEAALKLLNSISFTCRKVIFFKVLVCQDMAEEQFQFVPSTSRL
ncbi:hypothetical protein AVEN_107335-1 [Araneus ventricosus]|uniref:Uncharacterized protein n=1 Tax=Araneus ventricosus TaxID=182803 RepID=A0A4Y2G7E0_ARAVE|nr:hypothetical protein AVEN_271666-1 [Araneus ventricosus]GBM48529.1 hypothetical protein AVEN_107335-1 [Araneus ventricosus]